MIISVSYMSGNSTDVPEQVTNALLRYYQIKTVCLVYSTKVLGQVT